MKKKIPSLLFLSFCCLNVFPQQKNYKITYRHNVQFDTLKVLGDTIGTAAILIGNADESNYSFSKAMPAKVNVSVNKERTLEELVESKQSGTVRTKRGIKYDSIGNMVYINKKNLTVLVREKMTNEYIVTEEHSPIINWRITDETKLIKNYTCKKATTHFRGRDYIAWFTTEIPIVAAPWKFGGLPGLLVDIEDSKRQVKIYIERIDYPAQEPVPVFVDKGTKISIEKYVTFKNEEYKYYLHGLELMQMQQEGIQNAMANGGQKPTVTSKTTMYCIEIRLD